MATLRQYFDTDFRLLSAHSSWTVTTGEQQIQVIARAHYDFDAGVKFASYYVPAVDHAFRVCAELLNKVHVVFSNIENGVEVHSGWVGDDTEQAKDLSFSGRVYFYTEVELDLEETRKLKELATSASMTVHFRGRKMIEARSVTDQPRAFISHDFRDKDVVARPLAVALSRLMCPVWYDEFSLKVGDSLRESIERGLKECGKCIVVLSPSYLSNNRWSKVEFTSIFTRELIEEKKLILPIWYQVSKNEVFQYSPSLADRFAAICDGGADEVAHKLYPSITGSGGGNWWSVADKGIPSP